MPGRYPHYPERAQVHSYLRDFARAHGLLEKVRFGAEVAVLDRKGAQWRVGLTNGENHLYAGVVCATGINWDPLFPTYSGRFAGEIRHAVEYLDREALTGRRVLVVGGGNTGCDIACAAAAEAEVASISLRRGYHIVPRFVLGLPADLFASWTHKFSARARQSSFQMLLRLIVGDPHQWGWPEPDHRILDSHPIINSEILDALEGGRLSVKPDIGKLDGDWVEFEDGSRAAFDLIVFATGYKMNVPFADSGFFEWKGNKIDGYLSVFNRRFDTLFTQGFLVTNAGVFEDFDRLAHLVACYIVDRKSAPARAARFRSLVEAARPDLSGGFRFIDSPRHDTYVEHGAFRAEVENVRKRMRWPKPHRGLLSPGSSRSFS